MQWVVHDRSHDGAGHLELHTARLREGAPPLEVMKLSQVSVYVWPIHRRISALGERLGQLELATESRSYEQAIGCAEQGEQTSRLKSCFGLTEGEADLVMLLHGEASRRAAVDQFARRLIEVAQH